MKYVKFALASLIFAFMIAGPTLIVTSPTPVSAACENRLLGIPPWYRGLTTEVNGDCVIQSPTDAGGLQPFITKLALNIIEIGVVLAGYIAAFFILFGGFRFLTGGGNSSSIEAARKTILNAVIGLAIALGAVAILNLIFGILG